MRRDLRTLGFFPLGIVKPPLIILGSLLRLSTLRLFPLSILKSLLILLGSHLRTLRFLLVILKSLLIILGTLRFSLVILRSLLRTLSSSLLRILIRCRPTRLSILVRDFLRTFSALRRRGFAADTVDALVGAARRREVEESVFLGLARRLRARRLARLRALEQLHDLGEVVELGVEVQRGLLLEGLALALDLLDVLCAPELREAQRVHGRPRRPH
mmetsp:Transcript_53890/g.123105  ORF Transcript_53890/g.123105 Transcript_53890/m.123105 type:complete len:215 (-) Transcript_53890:212-856(-)